MSAETVRWEDGWQSRIKACRHTTAEIARTPGHVCPCGIKWKQRPYIPQGGPGGWFAEYMAPLSRRRVIGTRPVGTSREIGEPAGAPEDEPEETTP